MTNEYLHRAYLESKWCQDLMDMYLDENTDRFNLADHPTHQSFLHRSQRMIHIGSWKWLCNWQNREFLLELIFSHKIGMDFGGALAPIGGNTTIVDIADGYPKIDDMADKRFDYIYTSHTLEHVPNLDETLIKLYNTLKNGGIMYAAVPRYTCRRWRDDIIEGHVWNFSLEDGKFTRIDKMVEKAGFKITKAEYAWDDSIVIFAKKPIKL